MSECGRDEQRILFIAGEPSGDFADHLRLCRECADFVRDADEVIRHTRRNSESPAPAVVDRIVERAVATLNDARRHRAIRFVRSAIAASILVGLALLPWAMPKVEETGRKMVRMSVRSADVAVDAEIRDLKNVTERAAGADVVAPSSDDPVTDDMIANTRYAIARHAYTDDPIIDVTITQLRQRTDSIGLDETD